MTVSHRGEIGRLNHIVACGLIQFRIMPFPDHTVVGTALGIDPTGHRDVIFDMPVDHVLRITGRARHGAVEPGGVGVVLMVRYAEKPAWADVQMGDLRHQNSNLKQADAEHGQEKPDWWLATSPVGIRLGTGLEFRLGALLRFHQGWNVRVVMPEKGIVHCSVPDISGHER